MIRVGLLACLGLGLVACSNASQPGGGGGGVDLEANVTMLDVENVGSQPTRLWLVQPGFNIWGMRALPNAKLLAYGFSSDTSIDVAIFDATGQQVLKFDAPTVYSGRFADAIPLADGGYLVALLSTATYRGDDNQTTLLRYDAAGRVLWRIDRPGNNVYLSSMIELPDGRIFYGASDKWPDGKGVIGTLSATGEPLMQRVMETTRLPDDGTQINAGIYASPVQWWHRELDGTLVGKGDESASRYTSCGKPGLPIGDQTCAQSDGMLLQLRAKDDATLVSSEWIGGRLWTNLISFVDADVAADGSRWVQLHRNTQPDPEAILLREDASDHVQIAWTFQRAGGLNMRGVLSDGDGAIIAIGTNDDLTALTMTLLVRVDANGAITWTHRIPELADNQLFPMSRALVRLSDGTLVVSAPGRMMAPLVQQLVAYRAP